MPRHVGAPRGARCMDAWHARASPLTHTLTYITICRRQEGGDRPAGGHPVQAHHLPLTLPLLPCPLYQPPNNRCQEGGDRPPRGHPVQADHLPPQQEGRWRRPQPAAHRAARPGRQGRAGRVTGVRAARGRQQALGVCVCGPPRGACWWQAAALGSHAPLPPRRPPPLPPLFPINLPSPTSDQRDAAQGR